MRPRPDYEDGAQGSRVRKYAMHVYPGTNHGFHNNSTPRFSEDAAKLAWQRTIDLFKRQLA